MGITRRSALRLGIPGLLGTIAGCSGKQSSTPESSCPARRVTSVAYPETPSSLTNDSVVTYATDLEKAYQQRDHADGNTVEVSVTRMESIVEQTDGGYLVTLVIGFSTKGCLDGSLGVGSGGYEVRYYVNQTSVFRVQIDDKQSELDPREKGTRLPI